MDPSHMESCDEQYLLESSQASSRDYDALPLPQEYAYLQDQVECCRLLQRKRGELVGGPGDHLYLGPRPAGKSHTLVLDMDQTILLACSPEDEHHVNCTVRPTWEPDANTFLWVRGERRLIEVWYRPGLMEFLDTVSKHFEIVVFSAGDKRYVEWNISMIDPQKKYISTVFTCEDMSKYMLSRKRRRGVPEDEITLMLAKNIKGFFRGRHPRHRKRLVCVDDQIPYFVLNLGNVLPIREFRGDANDSQLMELCKFLISLVEAKDVREEIRKRCDLLAHVGAKS